MEPSLFSIGKHTEPRRGVHNRTTVRFAEDLGWHRLYQVGGHRGLQAMRLGEVSNEKMVASHGGCPKWLVYFRENRTLSWIMGPRFLKKMVAPRERNGWFSIVNPIDVHICDLRTIQISIIKWWFPWFRYVYWNGIYPSILLLDMSVETEHIYIYIHLYMGRCIVMGYANSWMLISGKIPISNGWELGVAPFIQDPKVDGLVEFIEMEYIHLYTWTYGLFTDMFTETEHIHL